MFRPHFAILALVVLSAAFLLPADLMAQTSTKFGAQDVVAGTNDIKEFLLGAVMYVVAVLTGSWAIFQALWANYTGLLSWGAVCLVSGLMGKFIDNVYNVSGMLIP